MDCIASSSCAQVCCEVIQACCLQTCYAHVVGSVGRILDKMLNGHYMDSFKLQTSRVKNSGRSSPCTSFHPYPESIAADYVVFVHYPHKSQHIRLCPSHPQHRSISTPQNAILYSHPNAILKSPTKSTLQPLKIMNEPFDPHRTFHVFRTEDERTSYIAIAIDGNPSRAQKHPSSTQHPRWIYFRRNEQPSVKRALPPVGWQRTVAQEPQMTTVWA